MSNLLQNFFAKVGIGQQQKQNVQSWWDKFFGGNNPEKSFASPIPTTPTNPAVPVAPQQKGYWYGENGPAKRYLGELPTSGIPPEITSRKVTPTPTPVAQRPRVAQEPITRVPPQTIVGSQPTPKSEYLPRNEIESLVKRYFNPDDVNTALDVIMRESSGRPGVINPNGGARGLFQFMPTPSKIKALEMYFGEDVYENGRILDPETNIKAGAALLYGELFRQSPGWQNWDVAKEISGLLDRGGKQFPKRKKL